MNIPKERNQKIGQAKEGLSCNKILQLNSEAMNARVLFFFLNVGMEVSLRLNNISVEKLVGEWYIVLVISDTISLPLVGLAGVVYSQRQKVQVNGEDGNEEIKEIKGQAVKVIRNEPNWGWRESQRVQ